MNNIVVVFLFGLSVTAVDGYLWYSRKKVGGDMGGYHSVYDYLAPFGVFFGVLLMVIAVAVVLLN